MVDCIVQVEGKGWVELAEVQLYGHVRLRLINTDSFTGVYILSTSYMWFGRLMR